MHTFIHILTGFFALAAMVIATYAVLTFEKLRRETPEGMKRDVRNVQLQIAELMEEHEKLLRLMHKKNSREMMRERREAEATPPEQSAADWKREQRKAMGMRLASGKHPASRA